MAHMDGKMFTNVALSERYLPAYYQQMEYMRKEFQKNTNKEQGGRKDERVHEQD